MRKINCKRSGDAADAVIDSKWPYFKLLLFLKDTMSRRDLKSSVPPPETSQTSRENITTDDEETCVSQSPGPSSDNDRIDNETEQQPAKKTFKHPLRKKPNPSDDIDRKLLQIEEEKLKCLQQNNNDSDAHFLSSLLPFLKDVPKHRKLIVQTKLMQVLIDEQNNVPPVVELSYCSNSTQSQNSVIDITPEQVSGSAISEYILEFNSDN